MHAATSSSVTPLSAFPFDGAAVMPIETIPATEIRYYLVVLDENRIALALRNAYSYDFFCE